MSALYDIVHNLDEQVPYELSKQIEVLSMVLFCISKLQRQAQYAYGQAEANRKRAFAHAFRSAEGSAAVREAIAETATTDFRYIESASEAELIEWKSAFYAMQELINAKKQTLHVLNRELGFGNGVGR
ncbi:hypothetical protein [Tumebacillus permanentifrigoris]|nr:hypothetical protein [Tumebacillus permanentifrigoris]